MSGATAVVGNEDHPFGAKIVLWPPVLTRGGKAEQPCERNQGEAGRGGRVHTRMLSHALLESRIAMGAVPGAFFGTFFAAK